MITNAQQFQEIVNKSWTMAPEDRDKISTGQVYSQLDRLILREQWETLNGIMGLSAGEMPSSIIMAVLSLVSPVKAKLPNYKAYLESARNTLIARNHMKPGLFDDFEIGDDNKCLGEHLTKKPKSFHQKITQTTTGIMNTIRKTFGFGK